MFRKTFMRRMTSGLAMVVLLAVGANAQEPVAEETSASPPDEIILKNGSRVLGTVTSVRDGVVKVETDFATARRLFTLICVLHIKG